MKKQEIKKKQRGRGITFGYISSWIVVIEIVFVLAMVTAWGLVTFNAWLCICGLFGMCLIGNTLFDLIENENRKDR